MKAPPDARVVAAAWIPSGPEDFFTALDSLTADGKLAVVVGRPACAALGPFGELPVERVDASSAVDLVNRVWAETGAHVLALSETVVIPPGFLEIALELLGTDIRVATVSFLSDATSFLTVTGGGPVGGAPRARRRSPDEREITRRLRSLPPRQQAAPIPHAAGAAVLVSSVALAAAGPLHEAPSGSLPAALADFSFRARNRGFVDLVDPSTFYPGACPSSAESPTPASLAPEDAAWLRARHPDLEAFRDRELGDVDSPVNLALSGARVRAVGLRVLIDGSSLGPVEMGTQVATMAVVAALADRPDVREVCVALDNAVPPYAQTSLDRPKVRAERVMTGTGLRQLFGRVDIAHRPYQPNEGFRARQWREVADRVVITVLDLISFHIGPYSGNTDVWLRYRDVIRESVAEVDGVVVISDDVRRQVELQRLPVAADRLFVVPIGTEHVSGLEELRMPAELTAAGFTDGEFLLCLGTDYTHKNRDLAVRAFHELRRRGHDVALVLAGPAVPWGSSREHERIGAGDSGGPGAGDVFVLPEISAPERNWLLRHASVVLYPTGAEGFGLIPFEAARFGTPTVSVAFGPLRDLAPWDDVAAPDWRPESLAAAAERLLTDPELADRQVRGRLEAGNELTWSQTAARLTVIYRELLARPPGRR